MCKTGDINLVDKYKHGESVLSKHSFVVLSVDNGEIQGVEYNMMCNVMGSFHNEQHKEFKLSFEGNMEVSNSETNTNPDNGKDGYIKADQLYYFRKEDLSYKVIGNVIEETLNKLIDYINELAEKNKLVNIIDNI